MKNKVAYEIITLDNTLKRYVMNKGKCELPKFPPSQVQMRIVHYLIENSNSTIYQRDLEKVLNIRRSTISGILKTMEKHNIIIRSDSLVDARSKKIELSASSKNFYEGSKKIFDDVDAILCKNIDEKDFEVFFKVIEKMKQNLDEKRED